MKDEVINVGRTEAQKRADKKSAKKIYNMMTVHIRKDSLLKELIDIASKKLNISKNDYMVTAIQQKLHSDGITPDLLNQPYTPPAPEPKQPKRYKIYMITERFFLDDPDSPEKYIAIFPTLKAAEKYVSNKLDRKAYPADWTYTISGRYMEGDNQRDAWDKLKVIVKKELETDRVNGIGEDGLSWLDRVNQDYPAEYVDTIKRENPDGVDSFDYDFSDIEDGENFDDDDEGEDEDE